MSCSSLAAGQPHPDWRAALLCGGWNKSARLVAGLLLLATERQVTNRSKHSAA